MKVVELAETPNFTVVLGVDDNHFNKLKLVIQNWREYRASLFKRPWVVFCELSPVNRSFLKLLTSQNPDVTIVDWPLAGTTVQYDGNPDIGRFGNPQREKMLSGFVHVPAMYVNTPYWLKLDLDVIAIGGEHVEEYWIDPTWFESTPAIIAHPWGYTKPANQIQILDQWAETHKLRLDFTSPPLNLVPEPGSSLVRHPRIISWCGFFNTDFTVECSYSANITSGYLKLPVPSQDGFMWYMAMRKGLPIVRINMKSHHRRWKQCSSEKSIIESLKELES